MKKPGISTCELLSRLSIRRRVAVLTDELYDCLFLCLLESAPRLFSLVLFLALSGLCRILFMFSQSVGV